MSATSPTEYETRIKQLEKLNATLAAEIDAERQRGQATGEAYLRLRRLIGQRAFDTPYGPTAEQVWTTTEIALAKLIAESERMRPIVDAVLAYTDSRRDPTKDRIALLHKIQYLAERYEATMEKANELSPA